MNIKITKRHLDNFCIDLLDIKRSLVKFTLQQNKIETKCHTCIHIAIYLVQFLDLIFGNRTTIVLCTLGLIKDL